MQSKRSLQVLAIVLAIAVLGTSAFAAVYFGDWTLTVSPLSIDFGNLDMNDFAASPAITVRYVGNNPSTLVSWNVAVSTPLPSGMSLSATLDGVAWTETTDLVSIDRNTDHTIVFTLGSGDALAGDYSFTIDINSGDNT
jgi:hypothetical protein